MAVRSGKWPMLVASAGATVALLASTARYATSGPIRDRPLAIHRPGTPNVGSALVNAAEEVLKRDRYAETERLAREALAIREKVLGPEHLALVRPLRLLLMSFACRDRFDEAESPLRRALAIVERNPAPPTPIGSRSSAGWPASRP